MGGTPGPKWCASHGLSYTRFRPLLNGTEVPLLADGSLSKVAAKLCEVLHVAPDDLWGYDLLHPLESNFTDLEWNRAQRASAIANQEQIFESALAQLETHQIQAVLDAVMGALSPMKRLVLTKRYIEGLTMEVCAKELGIPVAKARHHEMIALRVLRNPVRADILADLIEMRPKRRDEYRQEAQGYFVSRCRSPSQDWRERLAALEALKQPFGPHRP